MSDDASLSVWNSVLAAALRIPGVRVDRASFLRDTLAAYASPEVIEKAIDTTPVKAGISKANIRKAAEGSINWHRAGVSAISALSGLPGGWRVAGTIPADLAQYFWHVLVVLQKLAYLHGWPPLLPNDEFDDETKLVLTLFIGVMLGAHGATEGLSKLATAVSAEVVKRLPRAPLSKYVLYQLAKEIAKWIGVRLTKKKFAEYVARAVPIVGGVVAGTTTWISFGTGAKALLKHLESLPLAEA